MRYIQLLSIICICFNLTLQAESYVWSTVEDGSFGEPTKWTPNGVPGTTASDTAQFNFYNKTGDVRVFDAATAGTRSFASLDYGANSTVRQSWVNTTFDLGGNTWSLSGAWTQYTLGTFGNVTYNPAITFSNGTINVKGNFLTPRGGIEYGGRYSYIGPLSINAALWGTGGSGTTVIVSNGATIATSGNVEIPSKNYTGRKTRTTITGVGTKVTADGELAIGGGNSANRCGDNILTVRDGAYVKSKSALRLGDATDAGCGESNVVNVTNGGTVEVVRASASYGFRLGGNSGRCELNVSGAGSLVRFVNANWFVEDNAAASNNTVRVADGGRFETYAKNDAVGFTFGYGSGSRIVLENGGRFEFFSAAKKQNTFYLGAKDSAGRHSITIGKDCYFGVGDGVMDGTSTNRFCVNVGVPSGGTTGGVDCSLIVSNGTFNAWATDCNIYLGSGVANTRPLLRIIGDQAEVRAFHCELGEGAIIEFVPGPNGYEAIPLRLGKNFMWKNGDKSESAAPPKIVVDVKEWNPVANKLDMELVRAAKELSSYNWESGTNALKCVVKNAEIRNARPHEEWTVYATADLQHIRLGFKRHTGLSIIFR